MIILYGFVLFASEHGMALGTLRWELIVPFAVMLWSPFLAWELARKIRPEEEEDAYETYSKIFGRPGAVLAVAIAQGLSLVAVAWLWRSLSLSVPYLAIPIAAYAAFLFAGMRFVLWPDSRTAKLRSFAEAFIFCMLATQILEFGLA
jgi:heme O synthase-like polyprenyltransferase